MKKHLKRYIVFIYSLFKYKSVLLALLSHPLPTHHLLPTSIKHFLSFLIKALSLVTFLASLIPEHERTLYLTFKRCILFFPDMGTQSLTSSVPSINEPSIPSSRNVSSIQIHTSNS